jgi:hypothetical protein
LQSNIGNLPHDSIEGLLKYLFVGIRHEETYVVGNDIARGCGGSVVGDVVAQLMGMWWLSWQRQLGEPDRNAAVPGMIPASSTVSWGAEGIMTVYKNQISGCEESIPE